jgi:hypothetical protein
MARIPLIVGFGGVNAAGRTSGHHSYRRTVVESLDEERRGWRDTPGRWTARRSSGSLPAA